MVNDFENQQDGGKLKAGKCARTVSGPSGLCLNIVFYVDGLERFVPQPSALEWKKVLQPHWLVSYKECFGM